MKDYDKAVDVVAEQVRNINVLELMKQAKIHIGKDDLPDYLLAMGVFRVLSEKFNDENGFDFLREVLEEEITRSGNQS